MGLAGCSMQTDTQVKKAVVWLAQQVRLPAAAQPAHLKESVVDLPRLSMQALCLCKPDVLHSPPSCAPAVGGQAPAQADRRRLQ